jgi:hypothetical protein
MDPERGTSGNGSTGLMDEARSPRSFVTGFPDGNDGPNRFEEWLTKLEFEPKRTYAIEFASFVLGDAPRPERPSADWAVRVETKVQRLLSPGEARVTRPHSESGEPLTSIDGVMRMLGFDE